MPVGPAVRLESDFDCFIWAVDLNLGRGILSDGRMELTGTKEELTDLAQSGKVGYKSYRVAQNHGKNSAAIFSLNR